MCLKNGPTKARMTVTIDRCHSLMCCWSEAVVVGGLATERYSYKPFIDLRYGPFGKQAHHAVLVGLANELKSYLAWDSPPMQFFYDEIVEDERNEDPSIGTVEHMKETASRVIARSQTQP